MKKSVLITMVFGVLLVLVAGLVAAHEHNIEEVEKLIDSGISCDKLTNEQLETIGEYYMEQMHPGEAHELMDEMMGGDGSESLKQMHINIARNIYCEESGNMMGGGMMNGGMMGMMPMMMNMMGGGNMMGSGGMMQGIDGNYYRGYNIFGWLFMILIIIVLVLLIIWLIKQIQTPRRNRK